MAEKKVIAYCLHEHEFAAVKQRISNANWTRSYAIGSMDDADISALEAQGLVVEVVAERDTAQPSSVSDAPHATRRLRR